MGENLDEDKTSSFQLLTPFDKFVRITQLIVGIITWFLFMYGDFVAGVHLLPFTTELFLALAPKYAIPWAIIHGISGKEILDLIKAWKSK